MNNLLFYKIIFTSLIFFFFHISLSLAQTKFNPEISFLTGYTKTLSSNQVRQGEFDIKHSTVNFGFLISNKFELKNNYFLSTGIRYYNYRTSIQISNPPDFVFITEGSYAWIQGFESFSIPISFGKNLLLFRKISGEISCGGSLGMVQAGSSTYSTEGTYFRNIINPIIPVSIMQQNTTSSISSFIPTFDLGFNIQPSVKNPRFRLGVLLSTQLNQTFKTRYRKEIINPVSTESYKYDLTVHQQYLTTNFTVGYRFYKAKKMITRPTFNPLGRP